MKRNSSVEVAFHLFLRGGHEGNVAAASDSLCDEGVHWLTSVLRQDHQQFSQHFKLTVPWCDGGFGDAIAGDLEAGHTLSPGSPSGLSTGKFRYVLHVRSNGCVQQPYSAEAQLTVANAAASKLRPD